MPFSDPVTQFRDILESIDRINEYVWGLDFQGYLKDDKTRSAVERKIQIITEAVIRLEAGYRDAFPQIDWKGYRGMGNLLRHSYDRISDELIWNTIQEDLPALRRIAEAALANLTSSSSSLQPDSE